MFYVCLYNPSLASSTFAFYVFVFYCTVVKYFGIQVDVSLSEYFVCRCASVLVLIVLCQPKTNVMKKHI